MESKIKEKFLSEVFEHILGISKGVCNIDDEMIINGGSEIEQQVLQGLSYLHADLELNKKELRKAVENEFRLKSLEEKNKQLEQFNYVASHDLQEPLRTITNFSQLLKKDYGDNLDDIGNKYLDFVVQSSERMSELILGLLNFSRLGNGSVLELVNFQNLTQNIQADLQASIAEKNATIQIQKLPNLWGYKLELRQLIQNLISNALKFNKEDKDVLIEISCRKIDGEHIFRIRDNGIGIPKKHQDKIFILFQKLHHKSVFEGTGIGLANCQKIVELHKGNIWVESVVGEGSSFFFSIPNLKNN